MATNIVQPPIPASHLLPRLPKTKSTQNTLSYPTTLTRIYAQSKHYPSGSRPKQSLRAAASEQNSELLQNDTDTVALTKASIYQALEGTNRGVFGVTSAKKGEIEDLVMQLESQNPTPNPTLSLDKIIDTAEGKAVNVIKFSARGFSLLNGQLTIQASFSVASPSRVNIKYDNSQITPDQLMNLFKKNHDLLLSVFNPEGWLDITYLDDTMRIGRDDKGNIFILERATDGDQL